MSIAISETSCLKFLTDVDLSRRIESLCWISGCSRTVRLGKPAWTGGMGQEYTTSVNGCRYIEGSDPHPEPAVMSRVALVAALAIAAVPLSAQANPFKVAKPGLKTLAVTYSLTGDIAGTATVAMDGDRMARRQTSTMKMMGKTSSSDSWTLVTPDSSYMADLTKKQGTVMPNMLPIMARAYDGLDGDAKKRMHQNMQDMATMMSRAFSLSSLNSGEKLGTKTYAGQECEEKKFGSFSVCTMTKAPVMLHSQGSLVCMNFEETATSVILGAPPADAFTPPARMTFA